MGEVSQLENWNLKRHLIDLLANTFVWVRSDLLMAMITSPDAFNQIALDETQLGQSRVESLKQNTRFAYFLA